MFGSAGQSTGGFGAQTGSTGFGSVGSSMKPNEQSTPLLQKATGQGMFGPSMDKKEEVKKDGFGQSTTLF
jgi:hypothetical protein